VRLRPEHWLYTVPHRLRSLFRRNQLEQQLDEELRDHLERKTQLYKAAGLSPDDARRSARRDLDGLELRKEQCRDTRRVHVLENLLQDFRFGLRMLRKSPAFAITAILMLGLGIGANTAIFSVVNAVLLRPLAFPSPERLVRLNSTIAATGQPGGVSYPDFLDWRKHSTSFQNLAVFNQRGFALSGAGNPVRLEGAMVSADLFPLLAVPPELGRWFRPEEDQQGAAGGADAIVLSHRAWQRYFQSDQGILGRHVQLDHADFLVVGVMPEGFQFPIGPEAIDVWTTVAVDARASEGPKSMLAQRGVHYLSAVARLKPAVSVAVAETEMRRIVSALNEQNPNDGRRGINIAMERDHLAGDVRTGLLVLLAAAACVLLIACANLASLLLSRATTRRREMAIRTALGAGRRRILQQLLVENLCLAFAGAALALLLARLGIRFLLQLAPLDVPRLQQAAIDSRVLLFTAAAAVFTALALGLAPMLQLSGLHIVDAVKDGARGQSASAAPARLRSLLVIGQMSLAVVLLLGAGLLLQSLSRLLSVSLGFRSDHLVSFRANMPESYSDSQQDRFYQQLEAGLRHSPGVTSASAVFGLPLSGNMLGVSFDVDDRNIPDPEQPSANLNIAEPRYFQTLGIPLLKGRDFTQQDNLQSLPVAIINQALARQYFPGADPVGKHIRPGVANGYKTPPNRVIVGVVREVQSEGLREPPSPEVYVPMTQCPHVGSMAIVLRTELPPLFIIAGARSQAAALDKTVPLFNAKTLDEYLSASVAQPRFQVLLLGAFALLSVIVAAVGLYGAISYSVAQRSHEMGIRLALGAQRQDILRKVLGQGIMLAGLGLVIGLAAGLALARFMSSLLFGVSAQDPQTFAAVAVLLAVVALLASYFPARRATQVDPVYALRHE
jgi:putative ABC transport system permease protein